MANFASSTQFSCLITDLDSKKVLRIILEAVLPTLPILYKIATVLISTTTVHR